MNLDQARLQTRLREQTHYSSDKSSFRSASTPREEQLGPGDFAIADTPKRLPWRCTPQGQRWQPHREVVSPEGAR